MKYSASKLRNYKRNSVVETDGRRGGAKPAAPFQPTVIYPFRRNGTENDDDNTGSETGADTGLHSLNT